MNEHDIERVVQSLREVRVPPAVHDANCAAAQQALDRRMSPWWRKSIEVPLPAVLGAAALLFVSLGVHIVIGYGLTNRASSNDLVHAGNRGTNAEVERTQPAREVAAADVEVKKGVGPDELRRRVADANPRQRVMLLRRAGDVYLSEFGDVPRALECYQQVLELTSPAEWAVADPSDSWLLAELKQSMAKRARRS